MTTLVRFDIQVTEAEAHGLAHLLDGKLNGLLAAYDTMLRDGNEAGKHYSLLYRSKAAQAQFEAEVKA